MKIRHLSDARVYPRAYGELQLLCGNEAGEMRTDKADLKLIRINPGSETSHHYHLERESIFHTLEGRLVVKSVKAQVERELIAGDTLVAEPGEDHLFKNVGEGVALMYETESPPHDSSDKIPFGGVRLDAPPAMRALGKFWKQAPHVKLKICGVKNLDSAMECHRLGVDAIGIHAVGAKGIAKALADCEWIPHLPADLSVFLLTDATEVGTLRQLIERTRCDTVQIQGPKARSEVRMLAQLVRPWGVRVVKTISAAEGTTEEELARQVEEAEDLVDAVLVDSALYGGTGKKHNWQLTHTILSKLHVPLVIAGGIGTDDCGQLIGLLAPYGVDIESRAEIQIPIPPKKRLTAKNFEVIRRLVEIVAGTNP